MSRAPQKICKVCGRRFGWRKKWREEWEQVQHCSQRCRRQRRSAEDERLEEALMRLAEEHGRSRSFCPSEAAKRVFPGRWQAQMERARQATRRLAHAGKVRILQGGAVVDPSEFRGPIRVQIA